MTQKSAFGHHPTTLSGYIFATNAYIDNRENQLNNNISLTCPFNMVNFGPLAAEIGSLVWGRPTPPNFDGFRVLSSSLQSAATSLTGGQPNFARCLAVSCAATLYMHFRGLLPPDRILPGGKFTFHPSLVFSYIGSVLLHGTPAAGDVRRCTRNGITELSHRAPPIFSRAAITLGIGPHSSYNCIIKNIFYCPECT